MSAAHQALRGTRARGQQPGLRDGHHHRYHRWTVRGAHEALAIVGR